MALIGQAVSEEKIFEIVDDGRRTDDDRRRKDAGAWVYYKLTFEPSAQVTTLTEWDPSPLNFPKRKNMGPLNFHIQTTYQVSRS